MRFSLNFIKELLKVDIPADKLASLLTMSGMEVEHFEKSGDDWIFDIEVTSNRYDWLSTIGIAREIAACSHKKLKVEHPTVTKKPILKEREIIIEDYKDCPFYVVRVIRNVKVEESIQKLRERVLHCGLNSVNNIVDITNYCMLKWGNPLHAFDEDKLQGNIHIRRAKDGESFIGIDNKERALHKENLVIADDKKVIALAGVMGAKNTEVDNNTKNIFLEAAIFSPITIRRSRRTAGLDTESSYRFERRVFGDYLEFTSSEASRLIQSEAAGNFFGYKEAGRKPLVSKKKITISLSHLNAYLGDNFPKGKVKNILGNLDFKVTGASKDKVTVYPPSFRLDIEREVDIYEEFIRVYGYTNIKSKIPFLITQVNPENIYEFKNRLREFIPQLGLREVITYSIEAEKELKACAEENLIKLINPLREQENTLRSTLLLGMIKSIQYNINRGQDLLRLFELANIYFKNDNDFCEKPMLSVAVTGEQNNFFYLKKVVEEILKYVNINNFHFKEMSVINFTNALQIFVGGKNIGFLGKLDSRVRDNFDLRKDLFFAQLDVAYLQKNMESKQYKSFSQYPAVARDISMALNKGVKFEPVEQIIKEKGSNMVDLRIVDVYKGKDLAPGQAAFTLRIYYQSKSKTLTSEEVDIIHNTIREALSKKEGVTLR
ncbi:MAG: phenylalanine--tRNA ligase subunit beta [Candidatus Omnitrophota bacterium]|nr:phenylalanine--tRNA ligase subunit beta [Candidatus Omnitrophota bacterium]